MPTRFRRAFGLLALMLACVEKPNPSDAPLDDPSPPTEPAVEPEREVVRWIPLVRRPEGTSIEDIFLDPSGQVALVLEQSSRVALLWPKLEPEPSADVTPFALPIPLRTLELLSIAALREGGWLVAAIDTAGTAAVIEVQLDRPEGAAARHRFSLPPTDPLAELHVLAGGERLLGLGRDRRVRLYDRDGELLDLIDEPNFAPTQLRLAGSLEDLRAAVVLENPTRMQRLRLQDDRLERLGEPLEVELDRAPNLNDLQLSPDGSRVLSLRWINQRPYPGRDDGRWILTSTDFQTGEARVLTGLHSGPPRLLVVDDERAVLDSGDNGQWIDLRGGAPLAKGAKLPASPEQLPGAEVQPRPVKLRSWNRFDRVVTTNAGERRATALVGVLVSDPLTTETHFEFERPPLMGSEVALEAGGALVAWSTHDELLIDELELDPVRTTSAPACKVQYMQGLEFLDLEHLAIFPTRGPPVICVWRENRLIDPSELGLDPSITTSDRVRTVPQSHRDPRLVTAPHPGLVEESWRYGRPVEVRSSDQWVRMQLPSLVKTSADGHTLVAGETTLMVFDLDRLEPLWMSKHWVRGLSITADGSKIAVINSGLFVYARTGELLYEHEAPPAKVAEVND